MDSLRCNFTPYLNCRKPCKTAVQFSPYLINFIPLTHSSVLSSSSSSFSSTCKFSSKRLFNSSSQNHRLRKVLSAMVSEESATGSGSVSSLSDGFKLTYLEGNSWLWEVGGLKLLVDPILVGNLDFGIPWLYDAAKKFLKNFQLTDIPDVDCLLITQSLDDHCHMKTLKPLSEKFPNLRVVATPNAQANLDPLFSKVTYLEPGQNTEVEGRNGSKVGIRATAGPILGPPWQRPENGYIVSSSECQSTLYYEPHCVYNEGSLKEEQADIVITPVIKQLLPNFTLVSGQDDAVKLAKLLCAKFVVSMNNGDLESKGLLASIIQRVGTIESFKELLSKELPNAKVLEPIPGVALEIPAVELSEHEIL
ncbi:uncharacterized protein LOC104908429 [Beta vulgaris subsp. vulgaris]|uniref:uncharacterized protein LOC104908429 n=1 Tax=Beta vulgaris subsp. vulgaris TaxID=3555 RepID=UPI0020375DD4|nr:uncharacterized protein LOC104908429 [Beta vulgaris subsp. vulgaris]